MKRWLVLILLLLHTSLVVGATRYDETMVAKKSGGRELLVLPAAQVNVYEDGATASSTSTGTDVTVYDSGTITGGDTIQINGLTATVTSVPDSTSVLVDVSLTWSKGDRMLITSEQVTVYVDENLTESYNQPFSADLEGRVVFYWDESVGGNGTIDIRAVYSSTTLVLPGVAAPSTLTGGGHTIQDEGTPVTTRTNLNFTGAGVTCTDDGPSDATDCDIPAGGGSGDITAVGDCATGDCFQSEAATEVLAGPGGGGVAAFRALADADIPDTITVDLAATATALAANGANCSAGNAPLGVDASGAVEGCFSVQTAPTSFDAITSGTNTTAAMVMGDGGSLTLDTGGEIEASDVIIGGYNNTGATLFRCTAVYQSDFNIPNSIREVDIADSDDATKMPAIGLIHDDCTNGTVCRIAVSGTLEDSDTTSSVGGTWGNGTIVYVNATGTSTDDECGNTLTATRPTSATEAVQKIGEIDRAHPTQGKIVVSGAGRSNDVPNAIATAVNFEGEVRFDWDADQNYEMVFVSDFDLDGTLEMKDDLWEAIEAYCGSPPAPGTPWTCNENGLKMIPLAGTYAAPGDDNPDTTSGLLELPTNFTLECADGAVLKNNEWDDADDPDQAVIAILGQTQVAVRNCEIDGTWVTGSNKSTDSNSSEMGIYVTGDGTNSSDDIWIEGNYIHNTVHAGVYARTATDVFVVGNTFIDNGAPDNIGTFSPLPAIYFFSTGGDTSERFQANQNFISNPGAPGINFRRNASTDTLRYITSFSNIIADPDDNQPCLEMRGCSRCRMTKTLCINGDGVRFSNAINGQEQYFDGQGPGAAGGVNATEFSGVYGLDVYLDSDDDFGVDLGTYHTHPTFADVNVFGTSDTGQEAFIIQQPGRQVRFRDISAYTVESGMAWKNDHPNNFDSYAGTHTGAGNAATLEDSAQILWGTNDLVDRTVNNTTDGSTCEITANTSGEGVPDATVTCTLAGGTDNDWDTSDAYTIPQDLTTGNDEWVKIEGLTLEDVDLRFLEIEGTEIADVTIDGFTWGFGPTGVTQGTVRLDDPATTDVTIKNGEIRQAGQTGQIFGVRAETNRFTLADIQSNHDSSGAFGALFWVESGNACNDCKVSNVLVDGTGTTVAPTGAINIDGTAPGFMYDEIQCVGHSGDCVDINTFAVGQIHGTATDEATWYKVHGSTNTNECPASANEGDLCSDRDGETGTNCAGSTVECFLFTYSNSAWVGIPQ